MWHVSPSCRNNMRCSFISCRSYAIASFKKCTIHEWYRMDVLWPSATLLGNVSMLSVEQTCWRTTRVYKIHSQLFLSLHRSLLSFERKLRNVRVVISYISTVLIAPNWQLSHYWQLFISLYSNSLLLPCFERQLWTFRVVHSYICSFLINLNIQLLRNFFLLTTPHRRNGSKFIPYVSFGITDIFNGRYKTR